MATSDEALSDEQLSAHRKLWEDRLSECTKEGAKSMLPYIDASNLLGVDTSRKGISTAAKDSVYNVTLEHKRRFMEAVVLVRVGDFYEAMGFDAVMLVEYCGYNPMGAQPFKAGFPVAHLHSTLRGLTSRKLSVAVVEEVPSPIVYGRRPPSKQRVLGGVVTPESPLYLHNAVASAYAVDEDPPLPPSILGLFLDASGAFSLVTVRTALPDYFIASALPEATVVARLQAMPSAVLYSHTSVNGLPGMGKGNTTPLGGSKSHAGAALRNAIDMHEGAVRSFAGVSPVDSLLDCVREANNLDPDTPINRVVMPDDGPRPLVLSTALSLGVVLSGTTPDLVQSLLPKESPRAVVHAMRSLLLSPPDERTADALALALRHMLAHGQAFPPELPLIPAAQVARLINNRECNAPMFRRLLTLCRNFAQFNDTAGTGSLRRIAEALLTPAALESGVTMSLDTLIDKCARCVEAIDAVVAPEDSGDGSSARDAGAARSSRGLIGIKVGSVGDDSQPWPTGDCPIPENNILPLELFESNERGFRGLVKRACVQQAMDKLAAAAHSLNAAVLADLQPRVEAWGQAAAGDTRRKGAVSLTFDPDDNAIRLKMVAKPSDAVTVAPNLNLAPLIRPKDRRGMALDDSLWSTDAVEKAMDEYRRAVVATQHAVFDALRALSRRLVQEQLLVGLVGVSAFSLWLRLAREHTLECYSLRGWTLPQLVPADQPWQVEGLTPPWLERSGPLAAVPNSFTCDGLFLLTGPNMAGKSTIMRAAGACALLANCGLYVPATAAQVPRFRAFHVRMASADSPLAGLSHWALDMVEASAAMESANSLGRAACILLDELGQGTEVAHATAVAAALIKGLHASECRGMFATHLHGVLPLVQDLPHIGMKCMETAEGVPTLRMVDGSSTKSLAFEVAASQGVPASVVADAQAFLPRVSHDGKAREDGGNANVAPSHAPAASPRRYTLDDVAGMLKEQVKGFTDGRDVPQVTVPAGGGVTSEHCQRWAVYVFQHAGDFYVGQTGSVQNRIEHHRRSFSKDLVLTYILAPDEDATLQVEKYAQKELPRRGIRVYSDKDAKRKPSRGWEPARD